MGNHIAHLGQSLAFQAFGAGAGHMHAAFAKVSCSRPDVFDYHCVVGDRIGVRHAANIGEAAMRCSARACLDVFFIFKAGIAEVNMNVNQTREADLTTQIADFVVCLRRKVLPHFRDASVLDQNVTRLV